MSTWADWERLDQKLTEARQASPMFWRMIPDETIDTTPVKLVDKPLPGRKLLVVQNNGDKGIRVGDETVTATSGILIPPGGNQTFQLGDQVDVYVVATEDTSVVGGFQAY